MLLEFDYVASAKIKITKAKCKKNDVYLTFIDLSIPENPLLLYII